MTELTLDDATVKAAAEHLPRPRAEAARARSLDRELTARLLDDDDFSPSVANLESPSRLPDAAGKQAEHSRAQQVRTPIFPDPRLISGLALVAPAPVTAAAGHPPRPRAEAARAGHAHIEPSNPPAPARCACSKWSASLQLPLICVPSSHRPNPEERLDAIPGTLFQMATFAPDLIRALDSATESATVMGHEDVTQYHLLIGMLSEATFQSLLTSLGVDPEQVRLACIHSVDALLSPTTRNMEQSERPFARLSPDLDRSTQQLLDQTAAGVDRVGKSRVECADVLVTMLDAVEPAIQPLLSTLGIARMKLLEQIAILRTSYLSPQDTDRTAAQRLMIVILNDDYTTMDFVTGILATEFDLPYKTALDRMWTIHMRGNASFGPFEYAEAVDIAKRIQIKARTNGYPLQIRFEVARP